jgi:hypothetical protein
MCCGAKSATRNVARSSAMAPRAAAFSPAPARPSAPPVTIQFEYVGKTRLTIISPNTGARYHFDAPGARLSVDPQDQAMMIHVPGLRPVRIVRT